MKKILIALVVALGLAGIFGVNNVWAATAGGTPVSVNKTNYVSSCKATSATNRNCYRFFVFKVPKPGYVSLTTKFTIGESNSQTVYLESANSTKLARISYNRNGLTTQTTPLVGVQKDAYYIVEYESYGMDYTASFYINYKESNSFEIEQNNSYATANALAADITINGTLTNEDRDDYHVWTADYTGTARILFTKSDSMNTGAYELSIKNDNNEDLDKTIRVTKDSAKATSTSWFNVVKGKKYYFHVNAGAAYVPNGYYQVKVDTSRVNLENASVYVETSKVFTGSVIQPSVIVKYNGKKLVWGKDFSVVYSNNTQIGIAYATIIGKGGYSGTIKKSFVIKPKTPNLSLNTSIGKIYASWSKSYGGVSGYQLMYSTSSSMAGAKSAALKADKFSAGLALVSGKRYYFRVRAFKNTNGKLYYSDWSSTKSIVAK